MRSSAVVLLVVSVLAVGAAGCASGGGARPRPFPTATRPGTTARPIPPRTALPATPFAAALLDTALGLTGAPYRNGGADPGGFDCSGFVWYVFGRLGVDVPRTVSELFSTGTEVPPDRILPGDLLFFTTVAPGATHVALALGDGRFVHAPSSRGVVRVESLASTYWAARFVGVRRLGPDGSATVTRRDAAPYR